MNSAGNEEWREGRLLDVTQPTAPIGYGIVQPGPYVRNGVPVVAIRDLANLSDRTTHRSSPSIEAAYRRSRVTAGDILISVKGTTGRIGIVPKGFEGNISRDVARVRLTDDHEPEFWFQLLRSFTAQQTLQLAAVGSTRQELSIGTLKTLSFRFPSRTLQSKISEVLSGVDRLIDALELMVVKKQEIKQGLMQCLLTGKVRLPGFAEPWSMRSLSELLSYEQPGRYLVKTSKQLATGRVPVLTAGKTFILGFTNESHGVYRNHPVIIFDDFTTASKYVDFDFKAKSSAMKILSPKAGADLRFVYERMQLINFPLSDHKRYWISEYSKQEVLVPGEKEQAAVAQVLADADDEIGALKARVDKARSVKQGIMQELLTGRKRLPMEGETAV